MRKIRAKFRCDTVIPATEHYDSVAYLSAVIHTIDDVDKENESFSSATPSGQLTISISKDVPAHKYFHAGRHYYLDFYKIPLTEQEIKDDLLTDEHDELTFRKS